MFIDKNEPFSIRKTKILLVEGKDDVLFFDKLLGNINLQEAVQCIDVGGKDNFDNHFEAQILLDPNFLDVTNIAFIRDADNSKAADALETIKNSIIAIKKKENKLKNIITNCSVQENIYKDSISGITCGIFIMPDNNNEGMVED